jgi:hypothetical protein
MGQSPGKCRQSAHFIKVILGVNNLVSFKNPVISVSFCPADKIFASAPANFLLFGRTIQFCEVTKPGCRNGAATWAFKN